MSIDRAKLERPPVGGADELQQKLKIPAQQDHLQINGPKIDRQEIRKMLEKLGAPELHPGPRMDRPGERWDNPEHSGPPTPGPGGDEGDGI